MIEYDGREINPNRKYFEDNHQDNQEDRAASTF
jgi:hypothetical protein